ncbi:MAG: type II toxin-antitoxin system HipA family toxin [Gammaproteobacteria bacterium]|nr:type II toxin-antitoxin system HipA family toxin [Gammaproteobacteria bacterium]
MKGNDGKTVSILRLGLHDRLVGYLARLENGRNLLHFADEFRGDPIRPTFSLITHPGFARSDEVMAESWARNQKLHPTLSNLLPEGPLRELIAQRLKVHIDDEFRLLAHLGKDLPGALVVEPMDPDDVPPGILKRLGNAKAEWFESGGIGNQHSLAGVQMKFSMSEEKDGRFGLYGGDDLGGWIIKTPSAKHRNVPLNEFTAMSLATMAGIDIPEFNLVEVSKLRHLPQINLPDEKFAFAIERFDRRGNERIHMEDFAQVLVKYPHEKYHSANYEQIGKIIYEYSGDGLADAQQFARRLLVNILLANGDAHLKNWSLYYPDQITPRLSPSYDIVTTKVYFEDEKTFALNLGKTKKWYETGLATFERWADKSGIPWRAIKPHLDDTMEKARTLWPDALDNLPMDMDQKTVLRDHWSRLECEFRIQTERRAGGYS